MNEGFAEKIKTMSAADLRIYKMTTGHLRFLSTIIGVTVMWLILAYTSVLTIVGGFLILLPLANFAVGVDQAREIVLKRLEEIDPDKE